ncbi:MAG: PKD domain-containing protein [bacterium]|nr:PKD domain-containing protein [bacterium]
MLYNPIATQPISGTPPFLWNAVTNPESPDQPGGNDHSIDFTAPMTASIQPTVTFGISPTYNTHIISGDWLSATRWVGNYNVNYYTGDGVQRLRVAGATATNDGMEIPEDTRFTFEIATIGATSINAVPSYGQVALSWNASDLETTAGYNLYRATTSGGPYTRLNQTVMSTTSYTDTNVVNGTAYYYIVKLLTTDLYEMDYGTESAATPNDFTGPSTPMVVDDGTCMPNTNYLHAAWSASDPESEISAYQYSIGTWAGGTDVINWTSVGANTEVTRTGLSLGETVTYYVNVKAQNGVGTWSNVGSSDGIEINSGCPAVAFTASPRSGSYPLVVQFNDQSTGSVLAHLWDFGDGNTSSAADPSHVYSGVGVFPVTLTVTGTVASSTRMEPAYIVVNEPPPVAAFAAMSTDGVKPLTVDFTDESTGVIDTWLWAFGDGITSTLTNPTHTYTTAGVYTVSQLRGFLR